MSKVPPLQPRVSNSFVGRQKWLPLTHRGRVTHICVSKLTIIGSDNGLSPDRRQAIIWTNAGLMLIGPLGTNFSEILIEILTFSFKKMRLKVSSAKRRPFCLGLNVLMSDLFSLDTFQTVCVCDIGEQLRWDWFSGTKRDQATIAVSYPWIPRSQCCTFLLVPDHGRVNISKALLCDHCINETNLYSNGIQYQYVHISYKVMMSWVSKVKSLCRYLGIILLTWINVNPSVDMQIRPL